MLRRVLDGVARAVTRLIVLLLGGMLALLAYQVFMRSVLDAPPSWTEEVSLAAFTWAVLLGVPVCLRERGHVRMDLLVDQLPPAIGAVVEKLIHAGVAGVGAFLAYAGWNYMLSSAGTTSAAIGYPMPMLYAAAPVCGALIAVFALEALLCPPQPDPRDASEAVQPHRPGPPAADDGAPIARGHTA